LSLAKDAVPGNDRAPRSLIAVYCFVAVGGVPADLTLGFLHCLGS
jgi:hypothetical protein